MKQKKISTMKKKLWKVFAKYIKTRDNYICITCGKQNDGVGMHAGHLIPKRLCKEDLYFDEYNVNAQCFHCNINCGGFGAMYYHKLQMKYHTELPELLLNKWTMQKAQKPKKWSIEDYEYMIEVYDDKLKRLAERSN